LQNILHDFCDSNIITIIDVLYQLEMTLDRKYCFYDIAFSNIEAMKFHIDESLISFMKKLKHSRLRKRMFTKRRVPSF